jgi:SAM-dependent methyltransferase
MSQIRRERPATGPAEVRSRHDANRIAWNQAAREYARGNEECVRELRAGESSLHPVERAALQSLGPLRDWCRRAIHLQCASGHDTLSLMLEGAAEVVGIDISEVHIANARSIAGQLAMPAQWYCCDVLDAPAGLDGTADLVYTGRGALCWIHDIGAWAVVVARLLRNGGVLSLFDDHPASWLFSSDAATIQASGIGYFGHAESNQGWSQQYVGDLGMETSQHAVKHERLWTIAQVFTALVDAGMTVERLGEHPDEYWVAFPRLSAEDKAKIPMTFSMIARKRESHG